ncbi:MAG: hypothetical protein RIG82_07600 [Phycisphaeraceae bacterium]
MSEMEAIDRWLDVLRCPATGERLRREGEVLVSEVSGVRYAMEGGLLMLLAEKGVVKEGGGSGSAG